MSEKIQIKAVEEIRHIRDRQAAKLSGKSRKEIISFFTRAGKAAEKKFRRLRRPQAKAG